MKKTIQRLKNERGLTLVELLAVIVILAIIAVIAFVFIGGIIENSKKDAHIANAQQIISAAKLHEATGNEIPDAGIEISELVAQDYLEAGMLNPWDKKPYEFKKTDIVKVAEEKVEGKEINVFRVTFEGKECNIKNRSEADLSTKDRKVLCENTDTVPGNNG